MIFFKEDILLKKIGLIAGYSPLCTVLFINTQVKSTLDLKCAMKKEKGFVW